VAPGAALGLAGLGQTFAIHPHRSVTELLVVLPRCCHVLSLLCRISTLREIQDGSKLGYMALDRRGAELLFQVLTEREEKNSVAIASNESFSGWTKTFTDTRLCPAIVDRLTFGGNIIETGTDSYRLAHARQQLQHQWPRSSPRLGYTLSCILRVC
jgi:hypothetical protein